MTAKGGARNRPVHQGEGRKRSGSVPKVIAETQARMLDMLVHGSNMREISEAFEVSRSVAARMCRDAMLARAYELDKVTTQVARALIIDRTEALICAVMPLATGTMTGLPDLNAVREAATLLKLSAQLQGVQLTGARETKTENTTINLVNVETRRDEIMASLDQVAERAKIIHGAFSESS